MNNAFGPHKSSLGADANLIMLIAYFGAIIISFIPGLNVIAWAVPLVIFFIEKDSTYVKFHAMQSLILEIIGFVLGAALTLIIGIFSAFAIFAGSYSLLGMAGITTLVALIAPIIMFIFSIIAAVKSYDYSCYKIPVIGKLAEKIVFKN